MSSIAELARELVRRTCAAQGLNERITDPAVLRDIGAVVASAKTSDADTSAA